MRKPLRSARKTFSLSSLSESLNIVEVDIKLVCESGGSSGGSKASSELMYIREVGALCSVLCAL